MIKKNQNISMLLQLAFSIIGVFSISFGILALFFGDEIMSTLYLEHTDISSGIFKILMVSFFAMSASYVYGTLLTANNNLKQLNIMAAGAMVLNIILNLILIPRFEATGAAIASLTTQYVAAVTQVLIGIKIFKLKFDFNTLFRFLTFVSLAILASFLSNKNFDNWITGLLISSLLMIILSFLTKLLSIKGILTILKSKSLD